MHIRGQSGLDLLLGLLVLLIVLNVFSSVLVRFEEVQKEISIRQQLRENIILMGMLTSYAGTKYQGIHFYPLTNNTLIGFDLPLRANAYSRFTGIVDLEGVQSAGSQSAIPCSLVWDINLPQLNYLLTISGADSGLPYDMDINRTVRVDENYDLNHSFVKVGCVESFSIEAVP